MKSLLLAVLLACPGLSAQGQQESFLAGKVLGPNGQAVQRALVAAVPASGDWRGAATTRSDVNGHFRVLVKPGAYALTATLPGLRDAFLGKLNAKAGQGVPDLTLNMGSGGCLVTGSIVDKAGHQIKQGQVVLSRISEDEGDVFFAHMDGGKYEVTLAPGSYLLEAEAGQLVAKQQRIDIKGDVLARQIRVLQGPSKAGPEVKTWIKANAIPLVSPEAGHGFKDMAHLKTVIGNAHVVSLGEATHGTREFFQMKHRMLEYLVEQMDFTVFAIEANMPEARAVNEFVLTGKGDPEKALAGLYFWTWNTEEVLGMIRWMRQYNENPKHIKKVKFYGFDMQTPTVAYQSVRTYLGSVDPEAKAWLEGNLADLGQDSTARSKATIETKQALLAATKELLIRFDARRDDYIKAMGSEEFEWAKQDARVLGQYVELILESNGGYEVRDRCMAENTQWILNHEYGAKAVLWAHNGHVSASPAGAIAGFPSMGLHLRKTLGRDMVIFGFVFRNGGFQAVDSGPEKKGLISFNVAPHPKATLAEALFTAGSSLLVLDLRRLPNKGPVKAWFSSPQGAYDLGAMFSLQGQDGYMVNRTVTEEFDALIFLEKTSTARANPSGRRGGNSMAKLPQAPQKPRNLGFEEGSAGQTPPSWAMSLKMVEDGFKAETVSGGAREGLQALHLFHKSGTSTIGWGTTMQSVDPTTYLGKKVRLTGWIKTDGKPESKASLWMRVDRPAGTGFFDNAQSRATNASDWTPMVIEGMVDSDALSLNFGCLIWGTGHTWFDGLKLELVD